jgi:sugar phosphate permease
VAGSFLLGLAPSAAWAIVGRVLVGLGVSMLFVPTMKVLAEWFRPDEFATMTGILMAMGGLGSLTAAKPLASLSAWIGWRLSFVAVGAVTLALGILVWLFVRDRPADLGLPSPAGAAEQQRPQAIPLSQGVAQVLRHPPFWVLALWFFFDCAVFFSFGGLWGGPYLMHVYGLSKGEAGTVLSLFAVGMIVGSPLLSVVSNRVFRARKPVIVLCAAITLALTAALAFFTDSLPLPTLYVICFGLGAFTSSVVVIGFTSAKELFPVQIAGTSTGLINLFPFAGGAVFQPVLGAILERAGRTGNAFTVAGYQTALFTLFGCAAVALLLSLFLRETMGRS